MRLEGYTPTVHAGNPVSHRYWAAFRPRFLVDGIAIETGVAGQKCGCEVIRGSKGVREACGFPGSDAPCRIFPGLSPKRSRRNRRFVHIAEMRVFDPRGNTCWPEPHLHRCAVRDGGGVVPGVPLRGDRPATHLQPCGLESRQWTLHQMVNPFW